jgi:hypothetical protein
MPNAGTRRRLFDVARPPVVASEPDASQSGLAAPTTLLGPRWPGVQRQPALAPARSPFELEADRAARADRAETPSRITGRTTGSRLDDDLVQDELGSPGRPLDPALRKTLGSRLHHDFSTVRIHTGGAAAEAATELRARAFTHGRDIVFGAGEFAPVTARGRALLVHELAHVVQQSGAGAATVQRDPLPEAAADPVPVPDVEPVAAAEKTDEELANGIMDTQLAILEGWDAALGNFDKVLSSSSDEESKPDFQKAIAGFFEEKVMSGIVSLANVPGAGDAFALFGKLVDESKRAAAAGESASLRDFVVRHRTAVGKLKQMVLSLKDDFVARVRKTREAMEAADRAADAARKTKRGRNRGAQVTMRTDAATDAYGMMRMALVDGLEAADARLKGSSPEALFRTLSESWIRQQTVGIGMGYRTQAVVIVKLDPKHQLKEAHIQGTGGQKIAEQLLKDSPDGVDVFNLHVTRRFVLYAENGWPSAILELDPEGRNLNRGSYAEGDSGGLHQFLLANGLPRAKKLSGD